MSELSKIMKPIRFTLHYLAKVLYKLWQFIWAPLVVFIGWYAIGYLLSRLEIYRDMFVKGTPDWIMAMLSPLPTIGALAGVLVVILVAVVLSLTIWQIILDIQGLQPIKKLKDSYKNFK